MIDKLSTEGVAIEIPEHVEYEGKHFFVNAVYTKQHDVVFQFYDVTLDDFPSVIAEVIEDHFGRTDGFAIDYVKELDSFALLAKNLRENPMYNESYHINEFLDILDSTVTELRG